MFLSVCVPAGTYWVRHSGDYDLGRAPEFTSEVSPANSPPPGLLNVFKGPRNPASVSPLKCDHFFKAICKVRGVTRDPTGIVRPDVQGEIQTLRLYEEIIRRNPAWDSEQVDDALARKIFTPNRRARLEHVFRWVRETMIRFIQRQPATHFSKKEKKQIQNQLMRVQLRIPPPISIYSDEPDLLTKNDVYFERMSDGELRLRVGGAFVFTSISWFNMVFTFAHELGHSIDPCELKQDAISIASYTKIANCFKVQGLLRISADRVECGVGDQLSEIFADWIAVQITSEAIKTFASEFQGNDLLGAVVNSVRDLCDLEESLQESDLTFHPSPEIRIEKIFGQNPEMRKILGCASVSPMSYCSLSWEEQRK